MGTWESSKGWRGRVVSSRGHCAVVKSQDALIQVDLDPTYNPHLLLQQGGTEHYEFQECSRNFGRRQRVEISADFDLRVECALLARRECCCLLRFICWLQWILWPPNGLDHAEAGPNCCRCLEFFPLFLRLCLTGRKRRGEKKEFLKPNEKTLENLTDEFLKPKKRKEARELDR